MHADVLHLLDAHLAELNALRRSLTMPRPSQPGERHDAAVATLQSTRHFVAELGLILDDVHHADDRRLPDASSDSSPMLDQLSSTGVRRLRAHHRVGRLRSSVDRSEAGLVARPE
ncbi:hypothetical protein [Actinoplanes subglobosus]|uniref:CHAD domain-containing protein n=1 Tax=Actinoplanes subglobosus TaxID=1547892 RepID=A0ABV8IHK3_9ACTN